MSENDNIRFMIFEETRRRMEDVWNNYIKVCKDNLKEIEEEIKKQESDPEEFKRSWKNNLLQIENYERVRATGNDLSMLNMEESKVFLEKLEKEFQERFIQR